MDPSTGTLAVPVREPIIHYEDPLDRIWIGCAERIGLRVTRNPSAYATTDGRGTLSIAPREHLDPDDSLAQMILHELCHSLVEGLESFERVDWGLDNVSDRDVVREHACLRLQAWLTRPLGLARVLAPTTEFRAFWDALGPDVFVPEEDPSVPLARKAVARVDAPPWGPHLRAALDATAVIARQVSSFCRDPGSLWSLVDPPRSIHPSGFPNAAEGTAAARETCASCAWASSQRGGLRCLKADRPVRPQWAACERWEGALECGRCGACCREAFDTLEIEPRERILKRHPHLVVERDGRLELPRQGGRCPALDGEGSATAPYRCRIYRDRPRTCRTFRVGSPHCLLARRRVGLSI
jgi:hypothetical protein